MKPRWLVLARAGSWQVNPKRGETSAATDMTPHAWKVPRPFEYKTPQLQAGKCCGGSKYSATTPSLGNTCAKQESFGMENVSDSAGLLDTHDVNREQAAESAASLFPGLFHCTPLPPTLG